MGSGGCAGCHPFGLNVSPVRAEPVEASSGVPSRARAGCVAQTRRPGNASLPARLPWEDRLSVRVAQLTALAEGELRSNKRNEPVHEALKRRPDNRPSQATRFDRAPQPTRARLGNMGWRNGKRTPF